MTDDIDNDGTTLHESGGVVQPTDAQLAVAAYTGYDDYWVENSLGDETEAWLSSAKAVLALAVPQAPLQAEPVPVVASEVLKELIAASDEQDSWRMSHPALRQHLSTEEAHRIGDRVDKAWIAARRVAVLATPPAEPAAQKAEK